MQLRPSRSDGYSLVTSGDAEGVAAEVSRAAAISLADQGDQANGYRVFSARLPGQLLPEMVDRPARASNRTH